MNHCRSISVGVNIPDANLILYSIFTKIHSLALQILLRASTYLPNKTATVIDFSGQLTADNPVNPMTDFSEYTDKKTCREECLSTYDEFDIEFIPCLDSCKPEESIVCNIEKRIYTDPYKVDWKRIEGEGCERLSFVWENSYWSEPVPNSSNLYKFSKCKHCGSITRHTLVTLDNDPNDFILTNKDTISDSAYFIYDKTSGKAYIIVDKKSDTNYTASILNSSKEALIWLVKQFKGSAFHLFSNIALKKIPNSTFDNTLSQWVEFIDYQNVNKTINNIIKSSILNQIEELEYSTKMLRFMTVKREKEKAVMKYLGSNEELTKDRFNKELRLKILGHSFKRTPVTTGYERKQY